MKKLTVLTMLMSAFIPIAINPTTMVIALMVTSVMLTATVKTQTGSCWMPAVLVLTYSSGVMVLFMYVASTSPNETMKKKNKLIMMTTPAIAIMSTKQNQTNTKQSETLYSNSTPVIMASLLICALIISTKMTENTKSTLQSTI